MSPILCPFTTVLSRNKPHNRLSLVEAMTITNLTDSFIKVSFGRGVCGAAASTKSTQLVPDVEKFPGHIACDGASKSEIVVPILVKDGNVDGEPKLVAIIDVDCAFEGGFDQVDSEALEQLAGLLGRGCDW